MPEKIRGKVLIPLTLTFIILTASFLYTSYRIRIEDYESGLNQRYQRVENIFSNIVADRIKSMTSAVEFIADQKQLQTAIQSKDRETLLSQGSALLERLHSRQQITHFYFYDKSGSMVLRVYQPENTSESSDRYIKRQAMTQGSPVSGLEVGRVGTFTLRTVYPWKVHGELIGYIELGQEIDHVLRELKNITEIDFLITLDKRYLERQAWEQGMKMLGRSADWNLIADKVIIDQTMPIPGDIAAGLASTGSAYRMEGTTAQVDRRTFHVRSLPLIDASVRSVGDLIMLKDMTDQLASFRIFIGKILVFSFILSGGLFIFSYRLLGRVDLRLLETREQLRQELTKQEQTNQKLEIEIAERRRAEESLIGLNENLEQRVLDRTSELNTLNREIEANRKALEDAYKDLQAKQATILQQGKMACIGQLAAGVAHDINNPIGFVTGNLEVLKKYWSKISEFVALQSEVLESSALPPAMNRVEDARNKLKIDYLFSDFDAVLAESLDGTDRVKRIVLNLKGFSRLDETEARMADIHECLESTISIVRNELRYKADIKKDYGTIPRIYCHPQQLNQVFMNLLINAAHAIDRWGEIAIQTWADEKSIFISVADTGRGISVEHLPRIFDPFFTTKEEGLGTGLGLSIVYDIIKKHQGDIAVKSELNKGTVFTIRLPLRVPKPEPEQSHA